MTQQETPTNTSANTLYCDIACPKCGARVESGVGFRVGAIEQKSYKLGDKLNWEGAKLRPAQRPSNGSLKTIGYFDCDNLKCSTWADCYPEAQEALITIREDVISDVKPVVHKPEQMDFDILEINE